MGCMSERSDRGKSTIYDALPPGFPHVPHVGRLDKETVRRSKRNLANVFERLGFYLQYFFKKIAAMLCVIFRRG